MRTNFSKEEMKQRMAEDTSTPINYDATVKGTISLNIRKEPKGEIITTVDYGTNLTNVHFADSKKEWCEVTLPDGQTGFAMTEYLEFKPLQ